MRNLLKKLLSPILKKASAIYLKKPRLYSYKNISVSVHPGVFPPFLTISTKMLLDFIHPMDLNGKSVLELGCGCGILSILAAKKGAKATASDINQVALDALRKNSAANNVVVEIIYSDLFENLDSRSFDLILINPPYYPRDPQSVAEQAWFCGSDFNYFTRLFSQLSNLFGPPEIFIILSEDCDLETIFKLASQQNLELTVVLEKRVAGEKTFIFSITGAE